jgi:nicotinamide riboside kinase
MARKVAFVGSHGVRKTTAAFSLAAALRHRGVATEVLHEVARANPLGLNEAASAEAQLWILLTQVRRELELTPSTDVLVTDRAIVDNYAYALRAWGGSDRYAIEPFVAQWSRTYDLVVRLLPDIPLEPDGIRSLDPAFQSQIEALVDRLLPAFVPAQRLRTLPASAVQSGVDWDDLIRALNGPGG